MTQEFREPRPSTVVTITSSDRLHWSSIIGGAFLTLSLFILASVLARTFGLDYTYARAGTIGQQLVLVVWGAVAALICFAIGSWFATRIATLATRGFGILHGLMVWAVAVPILVLVLGSGFGPRLGQTSDESATVARQAAGQLQPVPTPTVQLTPAQLQIRDAARWILLSLGVGLIASCVTGLVAVRNGPAKPRKGTQASTGTTEKPRE